MTRKIETMDSLVDRLWMVYYPTLAIERVPDQVPHEDGALMWQAMNHILKPRLFFPDKPAMQSDSVTVRKYSGVAVAGRAQGVSIGFGYVWESYVDYGVPGMFLPILIWGAIMGYAYEFFLRTIYHRDLAIAFVTITFWASLYLFERSWLALLGRAGMVFIIMGSVTIWLDRFLIGRHFSPQTTPTTCITADDRRMVPR